MSPPGFNVSKISIHYLSITICKKKKHALTWSSYFSFLSFQRIFSNYCSWYTWLTLITFFSPISRPTWSSGPSRKTTVTLKNTPVRCSRRKFQLLFKTLQLNLPFDPGAPGEPGFPGLPAGPGVPITPMSPFDPLL